MSKISCCQKCQRKDLASKTFTYSNRILKESKSRAVRLWYWPGLEPDGPDDAAGIEDGGDADFPGYVSVLDDGCHAGLMGELDPGCKGDPLTAGKAGLHPTLLTLGTDLVL